ncbi:MAG TPA: hypothetical protein VGA42_10610 [Gemmatimonadales bacterium]
MSARHAVTGLGFLLLLAGCSGGTQSGSTAAPGPSAGGEAAFIRVENQSWANFNIFVVWQGSQQRLGRSTNNTTAVFPIPAFYLSPSGRDLQFRLDPIGADINAITRLIRVFPRDTVHLTIPPNF